MVGAPDGLGSLPNGDGTFSLYMNHELNASAGVVRAHGSTGAFVSHWTIDPVTLEVTNGEDLIQTVNTWSGGAYVTGTTAFGRFCSADLPALSAYYNSATGLGTTTRVHMNGEESGAEGRVFAHIVTGAQTGTSYELPRLGNANWENAVASPLSGDRTVVVMLDDTSGGQVYVYAGQKTDAGNDIEKAGLTNGDLLGLKVTGVPTESNANGLGAAVQPFTLHNFGDVSSVSGAMLQTQSVSNGVTAFQRPEDGHWDPNNPNDFYFVTTASFTTNSRLWRVRFDDVSQPEQGGQLEMLLDGSEGQRMLDNMTIDRFGHILMQEDPGDQDRLAKIWQYDIASDSLTELAAANPAFFMPGAAGFLTRNEESSGIIEAWETLGPGWFLLDVMAHYNIGDPELVEGGQLLALFNPASVPEPGCLAALGMILLATRRRRRGASPSLRTARRS